MDTATVTVFCNPPAGFRGKVHFMIGINDEVIGEGYAGEPRSPSVSTTSPSS